ncbi:hypothetical protein [Vibrio lentus]|uniref:Uncharacterized protein n=1 Tax=Vibrio lentus TaxID=136468 RepID=A0A855IUC0_9VIBR|nr:hypothetical protein [Vibrio lentus]PMM61306.1 hypothetical protein BCT50_21025 [Vibrio lentus]
MLKTYEVKMLDYMDWQLSCDLLVWDEIKSGRASDVLKLHKELVSNMNQYITSIQPAPFMVDSEVEKENIICNILTYLNVMHSGNECELEGVRSHFLKDYGDLYLPLMKSIMTESLANLTKSISKNCRVPWTTIAARAEKSPMGFDIYLDWLWKNYLSDSRFHPTLKPKLFTNEMWETWQANKNNSKVLEKKIPSTEGERVVEQWNEAKKNNYGLSAMTNGFLFDVDDIEVQIDGSKCDSSFIIYLPKKMDEQKFDSIIADVKAQIFEDSKPIETLKDYFTYYLPTTARSGRYKRQILKKRNQIIGNYAALLCDRIYHNKSNINASGKFEQEITSLESSAELACDYLKDCGMTYDSETLLKTRRKLLTDKLPNLKLNFD